MSITALLDALTHGALLRRCPSEGLGDERSERIRTSSPPPAYEHRRGTILVVDDEVAICSSLRRVFSRQHFVTVATSSGEAIELFRSGERYDVVLCDLMMPEVNGVDLFREVQRSASDQAERFVFMSGASLTASMSAFMSTVSNLFIPKPFDMSLLSTVVKERVASSIEAQ